MGRIIPYIMENKSHVPNHQPTINMCINLLNLLYKIILVIYEWIH